MDFDEYDYLEKAVEETGTPKEEKKSSRHHRDHDKDVKGERRRSSKDDELDGERRERREDRERSSRAERKEKDHQRSSRDGERDHEKDRDRRSRGDYREKDREKDREKERERERSRRHDREVEVEERERSRRSDSRSRRHEGEVDMEMEREQPKRSNSRSRRHDREVEVETERERSRRSSSRLRRYDREAEMEMERARSKDRSTREREAEWELNRKFKEKKEVVEPEVDPERDQRTVFAYQMPLKASERDVYEFFSQAGKVRDVRLIMDRNSRRSKGVGYIEFYDVMPVQAALELSGHQLLGQPVMVKRSEAEKNLVQSNAVGAAVGVGADRKLYIGNLHFNMTEDQLRQIFEAFGPVELVQLPLDIETGQCKGFGFVQFAQLEHAKLAQHSLNGTLEIAGRIIKVSAVTEHVGVQDTGTNATDFDDDDGGGLFDTCAIFIFIPLRRCIFSRKGKSDDLALRMGTAYRLSLNARSRALLMQKLDRTGTATSIAESLGVPVLNGAVPTPNTFGIAINGKAAVPATLPTSLPDTVVEPIGDPSECILLKNMFDPSTETEPDFDLDIKEDAQEECSKFGLVKHIFVDKNSSGHVYLRFDSVAAAASCQRAMHMRWFARRCISATFMRPHDYEAKFRNAI